MDYASKTVQLSQNILRTRVFSTQLVGGLKTYFPAFVKVCSVNQFFGIPNKYIWWRQVNRLMSEKFRLKKTHKKEFSSQVKPSARYCFFTKEAFCERRACLARSLEAYSKFYRSLGIEIKLFLMFWTKLWMVNQLKLFF